MIANEQPCNYDSECTTGHCGQFKNNQYKCCNSTYTPFGSLSDWCNNLSGGKGCYYDGQCKSADGCKDDYTCAGGNKRDHDRCTSNSDCDSGRCRPTGWFAGGRCQIQCPAGWTLFANKYCSTNRVIWTHDWMQSILIGMT